MADATNYPHVRKAIHTMTPKDEYPVVVTVAGSQLFGTDSVNSDRDYTGVFKSTIRQVILNQAVEHYAFKTNNEKNTRNSSEDVDFTAKELRKFLSDCMAGQMYALNMLFTPEHQVLYSSAIWRFIQTNRSKLLSRNVEPFLGYCKSQAFKYGMKGTRLDIAETVLNEAKEFLKSNTKATVEDFSHHLAAKHWLANKFGEKVMLTVIRNADCNKLHLTVLEKHYQLNRNLSYFIDSLGAVVAKYSARTRKAKGDGGIDWKALSHAIRVADEVLMLANLGEIVYPLPSAEHVKAIKFGLVPYQDVQDELMDKLAQVPGVLYQLPEQPDVEFWEAFIFRSYAPIASGS